MRVIVHIGAGKCGSSSIQNFLRVNRDALLEQGYVVPTSTLAEGGEFTGHHVGYFEGLRQTEQASAVFVRDLEACKAAAPTGAHTILLSAENLSNPNRWSAVFANVCPDGVVAYIRRQDDFLESAWQQWIAETGQDLREWLKQAVGKAGDWRASLKPWIGIAGREAITVRRFMLSELHDGDAVRDYANVIGLDCTSLQFPPPVNVALNAGFGRLLQTRGDNSLFEKVRARTGTKHVKQPNERLLSGAERIAILEHYSESNAWVRNEFFPELAARDEPLFSLSPQEATAPAIAPEVIEQQMRELLRDL